MGGKVDLSQVLKKVADKKAYLLDCREEQEWVAGHLEVAIFFPLSMLRKGEMPEGLDKELPLYIHCARGGRAVEAARWLLRQYPLAEALSCEFGDLKSLTE